MSPVPDASLPGGWAHRRAVQSLQKVSSTRAAAAAPGRQEAASTGVGCCSCAWGGWPEKRLELGTHTVMWLASRPQAATQSDGWRPAAAMT
jgi:hypothetical protein